MERYEANTHFFWQIILTAIYSCLQTGKPGLLAVMWYSFWNKNMDQNKKKNPIWTTHKKLGNAILRIFCKNDKTISVWQRAQCYRFVSGSLFTQFPKVIAPCGGFEIRSFILSSHRIMHEKDDQKNSYNTHHWGYAQSPPPRSRQSCCPRSNNIPQATVKK